VGFPPGVSAWRTTGRLVDVIHSHYGFLGMSGAAPASLGRAAGHSAHTLGKVEERAPWSRGAGPATDHREQRIVAEADR